MNEGCRRPSALREIIARHGVTRPRVFGGALQRSRSRMSSLDRHRPRDRLPPEFIAYRL